MDSAEWYVVVPCAGLYFEPKPGPQLAVRVQARSNFSREIVDTK